MSQGLHVVEVLFVYGSYRFPIPGGSGWVPDCENQVFFGTESSATEDRWIFQSTLLGKLPSEFLSSCHEYPWIGISTTKQVEYGQRLKASPLDFVQKLQPSSPSAPMSWHYRPAAVSPWNSPMVTCSGPSTFIHGGRILVKILQVEKGVKHTSQSIQFLLRIIYILVVFVACDIIDLKSKLKQWVSTRWKMIGVYLD